MGETFKRGGRSLFAAALAGAGLAAALVVSAGGAANTATTQAPKSTSPPTVSGTPVEGQTLTGSPGTWSGSNLGYAYHWLRCDKQGGGCAAIPNQGGSTYKLTESDVAGTIRFEVTATNNSGSSTAQSVPTAVIASSAPSVAAPKGTAPPTVSGNAVEGDTLTGTKGGWTGDNLGYADHWLRCDSHGGSCSAISNEGGSSYKLTSADVGNTLRFEVTATNSSGSATQESVPTGVVAPSAPATTPAAPTSNGCPSAAKGNTVGVSSVKAPARLQITNFQANPGRLGSQTSSFTLHVIVGDGCGHPVQGALVYAAVVPYNQFSVPPEGTTGNDGSVTLTLSRQSGYPASSRQELLAIFLRARKPGEPLLGGISTRRLISVPVSLG